MKFKTKFRLIPTSYKITHEMTQWILTVYVKLFVFISGNYVKRTDLALYFKLKHCISLPFWIISYVACFLIKNILM